MSLNLAEWSWAFSHVLKFLNKTEATKLQALNLRMYGVSVPRCAGRFQLDYSALFAHKETNVIDEVNLRTGEIK